MMRLVWATDIHLNFVSRSHARNIFCPSLLDRNPDHILISGDIAEAPSLEGWLALLCEQVSPCPLSVVLGNHDYYHGSIAGTRAQMAALSDRIPTLHWLPHGGPLQLTPRAFLVGHGGWGDGRLGDFLSTPIRINDHVLIAELSGLTRPALLARLRALGDEAAQVLDAQLHAVLRAGAAEVIVLTHVPPFQAACWHAGETPPADSPWLPDFTCGATGAVLLHHAQAQPSVHFRVLCGHSHGSGDSQIRDNLRVQTGGADYGTPAIAGIIDLSPEHAP